MILLIIPRAVYGLITKKELLPARPYVDEEPPMTRDDVWFHEKARKRYDQQD